MNIAQGIESWAKNSIEPLNIKLNDGDIQLTEKLRHLPNRRLTCLAQWQNKIVIAKFFYGVRAQQHVEKEASVLKALIKKGIRTPSLLGVYEEADCSVLIIEYMAHSTSLADWLKLEPEQLEFDSVISETTALMLECHRAGFEIQDPHLENFLISNGEVYIIDAGDIAQSNTPLSHESSLQNMALLYAQLPVTHDLIAFQVLKKTLSAVGYLDVPDEKTWQQRLISQRRWRQKKFIDKKVFRNCSAYICQQSRSRFLAAKRDFFTDEVAQALSNPDALIEQGFLLKDGNTATVARVEIAGETYVLKRYNIKKPVHALIRGLRWSRAAVSWRNGLLLEMLGIPTATSYVLIEERWGAMRRRSYLLSEYIDAPQAWDIFEGERFDEQEKKEWAKKIYNLFKLLKRCQISHGDLKAQNILCPPEGAMFIDLDGMRANQEFKAFDRQFVKDIKRFHKSWPDKWLSNPYFLQN
ncbi:MAG: lipopolysaccharide kinase InaA family protein [Cycloclasticus sp.]